MAELDIIVSAIDQTKQGLASAGRNIDKAEKKTSKFGVAAKAAGAGLVGLGVAGVAAGAKLVGSFLESAQQIQKWSTVTGVSGEQLQVLGKIAKAGGGDIEDVADGFREMQLRLAEFAELGSGPAGDALNIIGVKLEDIKDLKPEKQFDLLRDAIAKVKDPAKRLFVTEELLGGSAERLNSIINLSSSEYDNLSKEMSKNGITSDETIAKFAELDRQLQLLKAQGLELVRRAMAEVVPIILDLSKAIQDDAIPAIKQFLKDAKPTLREIGDGFRTLGDIIATTWKEALEPTFKALAVTVGFSVKQAMSNFNSMLKGFIQAAIGIRLAWQNIIKPTLEIMAEVYKAIWDNAIRPVFEVMGVVAKFVFGSILAPVFEGIASKFASMGQAIKAIYDFAIGPTMMAIGVGFQIAMATIQRIWDNVGKPVMSIAGATFKFLGEIAAKQFDRIATKFRGLWNGVRVVWDAVGKPIMSAIASAIASATSAIASLTSSIGSIPTPSGIAKGALGGIIDRIPGFAQGGIVGGPVGAPQLAIVHGGERVLTPQQQQGSTTIVLEIDGDAFGRFVVDATNKAARRGELNL